MAGRFGLSSRQNLLLKRDDRKSTLQIDLPYPCGSLRMNLNVLTGPQTRAYDKATLKLVTLIGSYHSISLRIFQNCGKEVTGETVRRWFLDRTVPTDMAFVLYEISERAINPLALCPWLAEHVVLKQ